MDEYTLCVAAQKHTLALSLSDTHKPFSLLLNINKDELLTV